MNRGKISVSMVGCCLVDRVYNNISFSDPSFSSFLSKYRGDGGLSPGKLVFKEEFEKFCQGEYSQALKKITKGRDPDKISIGGPGIVPFIHISQMLVSREVELSFYGCGGKDEMGEFIMSRLRQMDIPVKNYPLLSGYNTPSTIVLSDPHFDNGHGERIFINSIGAAFNYSPDKLDDDFFSSEIVVFGGTALVPQIHDNLTGLLKKAKSKGCITIVNTVYDFRNEKANPAIKWPLGESDISYQNIDLLITNYEEALRLSGQSSIENAIQFFREKGTMAVIITNGPNNIRGYSLHNSIFGELKNSQMPVSEEIYKELQNKWIGDTTGCGDNFAGGVIANVVFQLEKGIKKPDLIDACRWGIVSGGFSCFYLGGTYFEKYSGEKLELITSFYEKYLKQYKLINILNNENDKI